MSKLVTLILILHNRHKNLDRLMAYYRDVDFPVLIADSSAEKHHFAEPLTAQFTHLYTPRLSYTAKLEAVLQQVQTPYVVLCADDDFIIPAAIESCVQFLEKEPGYACAQGNCICYWKNSLNEAEIDFRPIYKRYDYHVTGHTALERIKALFNDYRSLLYGVHRTAPLREAFTGAGQAFNNLYLNEYLTAVIPMVYGAYKELPLLYQVREYAFDSDDKTADNIDTIVTNKAYREEWQRFVDFIARKTQRIAGLPDETVIARELNAIFVQFAGSVQQQNVPAVSWKKRLGQALAVMPLGKQLIAQNRVKEKNKALQLVLKTDADKQYLQQINQLLKTFH